MVDFNEGNNSKNQIGVIIQKRISNYKVPKEKEKKEKKKKRNSKECDWGNYFFFFQIELGLFKMTQKKRISGL